jgi:para-aminobenzoate synthetase/4-amino-4-deoxychorismate lyase
MIGNGEVILKKGGGWVHFKAPRRVISTDRTAEVLDALHEVETLVGREGRFAAGFIGYEAAPAFDHALQVHQAGNLPLLWFGIYDQPRTIQLPGADGRSFNLDWRPSVDRGGYNTAIEKIKEHIARGSTYQVNYTMRLGAQFDLDAWDLFLVLSRSQNKYAAYIDLGRFAVCSASPELFFHLDGERILCRPMKGTVARGRTTRGDGIQVEWLRNSEKNRAENVMIVDMVRNDLGRIASCGTVRVPELFAIEKYPTLFQMTSTVQAKTTASLPEILSALFPCASITGAPKVSTMKIIADLETSPRGVYTGCIGYVGPGREIQFNVAIRTAVVDRERKRIEYGIGGGIVWDSECGNEYDEAFLKARILTEPPPRFSLLETIRWTPEEEFFLLDRHLQRLADSAKYFDFQFPEDELTSRLQSIAQDFESPKRIRITLDKTGAFTTDATSFDPAPASMKVRLADRPVNSNNVFLYHKTTRREMYAEAALICDPPADGPKPHDEVLLFNQEDQLTEFTIGNLVVEMEGAFYTPPIVCGLLGGTFRAHLLEAGRVRERIIHREQLKTCQRIFLVNSLRKWVEVILLEQGG